MITGQERIRIISTDLLEHAATQAWRELQSAHASPEHIEVLKGKGSEPTEEDVRYVCRLVGAGPTASTVVAKWSHRGAAEIERAIYEEILPHLPVTSLTYYGMVEESSGEFCWLFLEDAGGEQYSARLAEHRFLISQWLGHVHVSSTQIAAASRLPHKGPNHYLNRLKSTREAILRHVVNHTLQDDDQNTLEAIVRHCDLLESHWDHVEALCAGMPPTLIHGDIAARNLRVRSNSHGMTLLPFDWAEAGWGVPATDIKRADAADYWSAVQTHWPWLNLQTIQRVALAGKIFRFLDAIYWEQQSLEFVWLTTPMNNMRSYESRIADVIGVVGFGK